MAEKTPSGFDIEPRTAEELAARINQPYVSQHRADPTLPCFLLARHQEERIAAIQQRFRVMP